MQDDLEYEKTEIARRLKDEVKRLAGGWYFIDEAAAAIALQHGWTDLRRMQFGGAMLQSGTSRRLRVRNPSNYHQVQEGESVSIACVVTRGDVNRWLISMGANFRWNPVERRRVAKVKVT